MAQIRVYFVALLVAVFMLGCSGSEYRFGNAKPASVVGLTVTPGSQTLTAAGQTAQLIATTNYSDLSSQGVTSQAQWTSSAPSIAAVSPGGIVTAVGTGSATVSATFKGVTGSAAITVNFVAPPSRTLTSMTLVPSTQTAMSIGEPGQFIAVGGYTSAPLTEDMTTQVIWSSSDSSVAQVTGPGLAMAVGAGTATISANSNGVVGTATLTVTAALQPPRTLTSISVIPGTQTSVTTNQPAQFIAIGNYIGNPATANLTNQVTWSSSAPAVASINSTGLAQTLSAGSTTILATASSGVVGTATLTVTSNSTPDQLTAINIIPSAQTALTIGDLGQFIAIGSYSGSPGTADITTKTTWSSSAPGVASVNSAGLATAIGPGTATLTASGDGTSGTNGVVGNATLTVTATAPPGELAAITLIPGTQTTLWMPETVQFLAIGTYNTPPYTRDITNQVQWSSSDTLAITIDATGLATTANTTPGTTIVAKATAVSGAIITGTAIINVQPAGGPGLPVLTVYMVGATAPQTPPPTPSPSPTPPPPPPPIPPTAPTQNIVYDTYTVPSTIYCPPVGYSPATWNPTADVNTCWGYFANHTQVTLVAETVPGQGYFGGFSQNCTPVVPDPNPKKCSKDPQVPSCTCLVNMDNSQFVGAIFNQF